MKRKYLALLRLLLALPANQETVELSLAEIEALTAAKLPKSARQQAGFWTGSATATINWEFDGFHARLDRLKRSVTFTRGTAPIT